MGHGKLAANFPSSSLYLEFESLSQTKINLLLLCRSSTKSVGRLAFNMDKVHGQTCPSLLQKRLMYGKRVCLRYSARKRMVAHLAVSEPCQKMAVTPHCVLVVAAYTRNLSLPGGVWGICALTVRVIYMESNFRDTLWKLRNSALKLKLFLAGKRNKSGLKENTPSINPSKWAMRWTSQGLRLLSFDSRVCGSI